MSSTPFVCKYFLQNACTRGDTCFYSHQTPLKNLSNPSTQIICAHHQRGFCRFGDQCKNVHAALPTSSSNGWRRTTDTNLTPGTENPSPRPYETYSLTRSGPQMPLTFGSCKFFQQGHCTKGTTCTFSHASSNALQNMRNSSTEPFREASHPFIMSPPPTADISRAVAMAFKYPCKFFAQGTCKKGDECQFSHQPPGVHRSSEESRPPRIWSRREDKVSISVPKTHLI